MNESRKKEAYTQYQRTLPALPRKESYILPKGDEVQCRIIWDRRAWNVLGLNIGGSTVPPYRSGRARVECSFRGEFINSACENTTSSSKTRARKEDKAYLHDPNSGYWVH
jgi:hypothetical protein